MKVFKLILLAIIVILLICSVIVALQPYEPVRRTQARQPATECPPDTKKGTYHVRGYDDQGNVSCGFTYFNACPYFEAAEAGTPECENAKPTEKQLERWQPENDTKSAQPPAAQCVGK